MDNVRHSSASNEHYTPPDVIEAARETLGRIDLDPASSLLANSVVAAMSIYTKDDNGFQRPWHRRVFLNPPGGKCDARGVTVTSIPKTRGAAHKGEGKPRPIRSDYGPRAHWWTCNEDSTPCNHVGTPEDHLDIESSQKRWWRKLVDEWATHNVEQAIFIGFSLEILQVAQSGAGPGEFSPLDFPICVPSTRLAYFHEDETGKLVEGGAPPHASVIVFLPPGECISGTGTHNFTEAVTRFKQAFSKFGKVVWGGEP